MTTSNYRKFHYITAALFVFGCAVSPIIVEETVTALGVILILFLIIMFAVLMYSTLDIFSNEVYGEMEDTTPTDIRIVRVCLLNKSTKYQLQQLGLYGWWRTFKTYDTLESAEEQKRRITDCYDKKIGENVITSTVVDNTETDLQNKVVELERLLEERRKLSSTNVF